MTASRYHASRPYRTASPIRYSRDMYVGGRYTCTHREGGGRGGEGRGGEGRVGEGRYHCSGDDFFTETGSPHRGPSLTFYFLPPTLSV